MQTDLPTAACVRRRRRRRRGQVSQRLEHKKSDTPGNLASLGYAHEPIALNGDGAKTDAHLPAVHIAFSNLKTWLMGTHHGVSKQHLQAYLNEFTFRFNRRFYPMTAFNSILGLATHAEAPTYDSL